MIALSREVVHLQPDDRALACRGRLRHLADLVDQAVAEVERRDEELAERLRPAEPRDVVEQVRDVLGDLGIGGEQPEVLVEHVP